MIDRRELAAQLREILKGFDGQILRGGTFLALAQFAANYADEIIEALEKAELYDENCKIHDGIRSMVEQDSKRMERRIKEIFGEDTPNDEVQE